MRELVVPNFFLAGTGKAGTTSLYHYLRQHPQIYMSPVKEPCYFASEIHPRNLDASYAEHIRRISRHLEDRPQSGLPVTRSSWLVKEWDDYLSLFEGAQNETAIGEASVGYLWSETAPWNIAQLIPGARIVIILRDPAERAFSQYLHQLAVGLTRLTFRRHIEKCMSVRDSRLSAYYPFLDVGLYSRQVKRYLDQFPRQNIRIYWHEEAWSEPRLFLRDVFEFLGVDPAFCPDMSGRNLERRAPRFRLMNYAAKRFNVTHRVSELMPGQARAIISRLLFRRNAELRMAPEDRQLLIDYYRDDIAKLAALLNRDLSAWLEVQVGERSNDEETADGGKTVGAM